MSEILLGAVGMLLALAIISGAFILGWKCNDVYRAKAQKVVARELSEKQLQKEKEDNEAFHQLLGFNADIAYGIKKPEGWGE